MTRSAQGKPNAKRAGVSRRVNIPAHLYVHVPFCSGKCNYCAFYSEIANKDRFQTYLSALHREVVHTVRSSRPAAETVYFGGGTPSILPARELAQLCETVSTHFNIPELHEWTIEGNPGTFTPSKLKLLKDIGVNRISLGAQSFDNTTLRFLGRRHDAKAIGATLDLVRKAGFDNVGLDLIAAIPDVESSSWRQSVREAVSLEPAHISIYCLSIEDGSGFAALAASHGLKLPEHNAQLQALSEASDILGPAGYVRYEISNYARPGRECLHNLAMWRGGDYIGFGPAASSRVLRKRWTTKPSLESYISSVALNGTAERMEAETLSVRTDILERLAFAFRLMEGVNLHHFPGLRTGRLDRACLTALSQLAEAGLVSRRDDVWIPSIRGFDLADTIASEILSAE